MSQFHITIAAYSSQHRSHLSSSSHEWMSQRCANVVLILGLRLKIIHTFTVCGAPPYILTPIAKWLMIASTHNLTQDTRVVTDTVELQYTTPAVGSPSRSRRTLHTHTDTLARSRFATPLNIRFPRCDI